MDTQNINYVSLIHIFYIYFFANYHMNVPLNCLGRKYNTHCTLKPTILKRGVKTAERIPAAL